MKKYEVLAELRCSYTIYAENEDEAIKKAKEKIDFESDSNISSQMYFDATEGE